MSLLTSSQCAALPPQVLCVLLQVPYFIIICFLVRTLSMGNGIGYGLNYLLILEVRFFLSPLSSGTSTAACCGLLYLLPSLPVVLSHILTSLLYLSSLF